MSTFLHTLWEWINDASSLIAPQRCAVCGRRLRNHERHICLACYSSLPFTNIKGERGNKVEKIFWGQIPIRRANSFLQYYPKSESSHIFLQLKYGHRPQIGYTFGRIMANDLIDSDFFDNIDCIIPIPLALKRLKKRGYNQSEYLAKGVSDITGIPIDTHSVIREVSNPTQTRLSATERKENVKDIFSLSKYHTLNHKHILLIDDILTTGATLISCAKEISKAPQTKISILTLGLAGFHFSIEKKDKSEE